MGTMVGGPSGALWRHLVHDATALGRSAWAFGRTAARYLSNHTGLPMALVALASGLCLVFVSIRVVGRALRLFAQVSVLVLAMVLATRFGLVRF
jgi:hypothetical protein